MFVEINNSEMNVPQVLDWINRTKKDNGNVISPEFAMKILGKTNFYGHIKVVLKNIKENCKTREDIEPYREFILSAVDRREVSPQAMAVLQELAETGGFKDEFDKTNDKVKIYEVKDCENADVKIIKSKKEFEALGGENLRIFFDADEVDLKDCDLEGVEKITFREGAEVDLSFAENLPKELDLSMCSKVDLSGCILEGVEKITFREGAVVDLYVATELPKELDLSICSKVDMTDCDLEGVEKIKFKDKAQEKEFMDGAMGFNGKVEYVGDEKSIGLVNGNSGMEM